MTNTEKKNNLIILTGPTAVGKTALSLKLANDVGGEIVSADSIQVYKHFDIGSAKILPEEMQGITHHLIDILEPKDSFNVMEFKKYAEEAMAGIYERGHIPIITGGTGFYIQALLYDISIDDLLAGNTGTKKESKLEKAKKLILELLGKRKMMCLEELEAELQAYEISARTGRDARKDLEDQLIYGWYQSRKTISLKKDS